MTEESCSIHPRYHGLRKPVTDCPECWALYNKNKEVIQLNKEVDIIETEQPIEELDKSIKHIEEITLSDIKTLKINIPKDIEEKISNSIQEAFNKYFKIYEQKLHEISNIQYEHFDIPLRKFNSKLMYKLEKDGWCYKDMFRGDVAKNSGFKEDVVVFVRVKNSKNKPKPEIE